MTGWRVGWTISPPSLTGAIRKVHDFLTVGAPAPLQEAGAVALGLPEEYYAALAANYQQRRDVLLEILERHHFTCYKPLGAYYIMTDISAFGFADDVEFARYLVKDVGVAAVPGSSFYKSSDGGPHEAAVLFLQARRDAGGSGSADGEARAGRRDAALRSGYRSLKIEGPTGSDRAEQAATLQVGLRTSDFELSDFRLQYRTTAPKYRPFSTNEPVSVLIRYPTSSDAIAALHADVVVEIQRAVEVEVDVVRGVSAVDAVGNLEGGELTGDRDVRHHVEASDAAERRNRRARVRELDRERDWRAGPARPCTWLP